MLTFLLAVVVVAAAVAEGASAVVAGSEPLLPESLKLYKYPQLK